MTPNTQPQPAHGDTWLTRVIARRRIEGDADPNAAVAKFNSCLG